MKTTTQLFGGLACVLLVASVGLIGCGGDKMESKPDTASGVSVPVGRIRVERIGKFSDDIAYNDERGIYIITDTKTGREWIGISGIGISESGSHPANKSNVRDER